MPENSPAGADAAAVRSHISSAMRGCYVGYRRAQAELGAWLEITRDEDSSIEKQLRGREGTSLDELIKLPAASVADLAVKLEVLRELSSGESPVVSREVLASLAEDSLRLATRSESEGRMIALRLTLTLLLNAAAADRDGLERARQAVLDLIDRADSPWAADAQLAQAAKEEVGALFSWID